MLFCNLVLHRGEINNMGMPLHTGHTKTLSPRRCYALLSDDYDAEPWCHLVVRPKGERSPSKDVTCHGIASRAPGTSLGQFDRCQRCRSDQQLDRALRVIPSCLSLSPSTLPLRLPACLPACLCDVSHSSRRWRLPDHTGGPVAEPDSDKLTVSTRA